MVLLTVLQSLELLAAIVQIFCSSLFAMHVCGGDVFRFLYLLLLL